MGKDTKLVILQGRLKNGVVLDNSSATLIGGRFIPKIPKSYTGIGVVLHDMGDRYGSGLMQIYRAKDGTYRYSTYLDGNLYPVVGKIILRW